ncbi:MAG: SGNH/GDSL hydrolase family protein [Nocardioidaceae bacterium]
MGRSGVRRLLTSRALYGGGGLGLAGGGLFGVIKLEALLARRSIGPASSTPPEADGSYGAHLPGDPLTLLVLGDSAAAGYGVDEPACTPAAMLGTDLAVSTGRPVQVTCRAFVGACSADLDGQIDSVTIHPDVTVVIVGVNDITHGVRRSAAVAALGRAAQRLVDGGSRVVVGTCPDMGTIGPVAPPLRQVARFLSRRMAAAQTVAVVEAGGLTVSLAALLGRQFAQSPGKFFGADRFHPSQAGYTSMVQVLLPSVIASLEDADTAGDLPLARREPVLPVRAAAWEAAYLAGTEVSSASVAGRERGPRGRWAQLRHRRRALPPEATAGAARPDVGERELADVAGQSCGVS